MNKYLCAKCVVNLIEDNRLKPLTHYWGANKIPLKEGNCEHCDEHDTCLMAVPSEEILPKP